MQVFQSRRFKEFSNGPFQRFCSGTSFHGFSDFNTAKTVVWHVIWWVVILFAICITIYQMYFTTVEFMDQASITSVEPATEDGLVYPKLGVCYGHWMYWIDWVKADRDGFSKEAIMYGVSFLKFIFSDKVFDRDVARQHFADAMVKNKLTTITQFYQTYSINFRQIMGSFPVYPRLIDPPTVFTKRNIYYKDGEYFMCYTMDQTEIAEMLRERKEASKSQNIRSSNIVFNFSMQDLDYKNYKNYMTRDEYNYYVAFWVCDRSNYWVVTLEDFAKDYTNYTIPIILYPDISNDQFILVKTEDLQYDILMTPTVQRTKNSIEQPCVEKGRGMVTDDQCEKQCNAEFGNEVNECKFIDQAARLGLDTIDHLCSNPINFLENQRENPDYASHPCDNYVPNGTHDPLRQTGQILPPNSKPVPSDKEIEKFRMINNDCKNNCTVHKPCEVWRYAVTVSVLTSSTIVMANSHKNQTVFNMYYPDASHVMIVVTVDAQTWEGYVANVGGLLGVWTGASIISFLQVPYLCCLADVEFCKGTKKQKKRKKGKKANGKSGKSESPNIVFTTRTDVTPIVLAVEEKASLDNYTNSDTMVPNINYPIVGDMPVFIHNGAGNEIHAPEILLA